MVSSALTLLPSLEAPCAPAQAGAEGGTALRRVGRNLAALCGAGLLLAALAMPAQAERRLALVIGNAEYSHAPLLRNPVQDAARVTAILRQLDFDVTTVTNADKIGHGGGDPALHHVGGRCRRRVVLLLGPRLPGRGSQLSRADLCCDHRAARPQSRYLRASGRQRRDATGRCQDPAAVPRRLPRQSVRRRLGREARLFAHPRARADHHTHGVARRLLDLPRTGCPRWERRRQPVHRLFRPLRDRAEAGNPAGAEPRPQRGLADHRRSSGPVGRFLAGERLLYGASESPSGFRPCDARVARRNLGCAAAAVEGAGPARGRCADHHGPAHARFWSANAERSRSGGERSAETGRLRVPHLRWPVRRGSRFVRLQGG